MLLGTFLTLTDILLHTNAHSGRGVKKHPLKPQDEAPLFRATRGSLSVRRRPPYLAERPDAKILAQDELAYLHWSLLHGVVAGWRGRDR